MQAVFLTYAVRNITMLSGTFLLRKTTMQSVTFRKPPLPTRVHHSPAGPHLAVTSQVAYADDCKRLFGRTLDHPLIQDDALAFGSAMSLWASECPTEPWDPTPGTAQPEVGDVEARIVAAMGRQASFFYQVNRPGFLVSHHCF
jgi:hypothetical protein